jgi:phosphoserine phosphatase RsbU/P
VHRLQRSLLPDRLPRIRGLRCAARYVPGGADQLGGDWYDVFPLPSGAVCVAIGDVVGKGTKAAVIMGRMREALRAYALEVDDPAAVLSRLDSMFGHFEPDVMATVLFGVFVPGFEQVKLSSAGHPPPCIASPDGRAQALELRPDAPIGAGFTGARRTTMVAVGPGQTLYLYTDGVVERRDTAIDVGIDRLCEVVEAGDPESGCMQVAAHLLAGGQPEDDWAVLALHRPAPA